VYVQKWIDYSSKYGLGYLLSNKVIGIYFNDNTKMLGDIRNDEKVNYFTRVVSTEDPSKIQ